MSSLDSRIDALYQGPLENFTASRNALAKTLSGDTRKQVSALPKPLAIPWIVNQVYWHAREVYDELLAAGKKLRTAQVGALQGRSPDIRSASDRHAEALTKAMSEATRLAKAGGVQPQADALRRMFEAISTRASLPVEHGRFVNRQPQKDDAQHQPVLVKAISLLHLGKSSEDEQRAARQQGTR